MKNVIIIHGCPSNAEKAMDEATRTYDKHWIPSTRQKLEEKGITVETPLMPEPWEPNYETFKKEFEKYTVTEESILVGHSCGTTFLTRWLAESGQKVAKLILVGPWCIADEDSEAKQNFYEHPINSVLNNTVGEIIAFTSNTEDDDGKKSLEIFKQTLNIKVIDLPNRGHYTEGDMGTTEFPELLEEILN